MATKVLTATEPESYGPAVAQAAEVLRAGGLVAIPTETVYGIAVSADVSDAVERLRELKGQARHGPFTVHISRSADAEQFTNGLTGQQRRVVQRGWPGPLTIIFDVPDPTRTPVASGRDPGFIDRVFHDGSVGLRCPDLAAARDVLAEAGCVCLATSANAHGQPPPASAAEVIEHLDGQVDLVLDAGPSNYAKASTIIRLRDRRAEVLRAGVIDERMIQRFMHTTIVLVCTGNTCRSPMAEGLLKKQLADQLGCAAAELDHEGYRVVSAGTYAVDGAPATPEAVQAMAELNIDITNHRSTALGRDLVDQAQIILCMTPSHKAVVDSLGPDAAGKSFLLGGHEAVTDPIGGAVGDYRQCRDQIAQGLTRQLTERIL